MRISLFEEVVEAIKDSRNGVAVCNNDNVSRRVTFFYEAVDGLCVYYRGDIIVFDQMPDWLVEVIWSYVRSLRPDQPKSPLHLLAECLVDES